MNESHELTRYFISLKVITGAPIRDASIGARMFRHGNVTDATFLVGYFIHL